MCLIPEIETYQSMNLALPSTLPCEPLSPLHAKIMSLDFIDPILGQMAYILVIA